jgi:outer membrane biosynthesis protein TonB
VRPDGSVSDTSIVASPAPALGECVTAAMKKAEFGKSVGGGSFTYPFVF